MDEASHDKYCTDIVRNVPDIDVTAIGILHNAEEDT